MTESERSRSAKRISESYQRLVAEIARHRKLLGKEEAAKYMWAGRHKAAMSGLKAAVEVLERDVPTYANT